MEDGDLDDNLKIETRAYEGGHGYVSHSGYGAGYGHGYGTYGGYGGYPGGYGGEFDQLRPIRNSTNFVINLKQLIVDMVATPLTTLMAATGASAMAMDEAKVQVSSFHDIFALSG